MLFTSMINPNVVIINISKLRILDGIKLNSKDLICAVALAFDVGQAQVWTRVGVGHKVHCRRKRKGKPMRTHPAIAIRVNDDKHKGCREGGNGAKRCPLFWGSLLVSKSAPFVIEATPSSWSAPKGMPPSKLNPLSPMALDMGVGMMKRRKCRRK